MRLIGLILEQAAANLQAVLIINGNMIIEKLVIVGLGGRVIR